MDLLKLPLVAQRIVLRQMELSESVLLSFTSTKAFRVMQSVGLLKTDVVLLILWKYAEERNTIFISNSDADVLVLWRVQKDEPTAQTQRVTISNKCLNCKYSTDEVLGQATTHVLSNKGDPVEQLLLLQRHLTDLFRVQVDVNGLLVPYKMSTCPLFRRLKGYLDHVLVGKKHIRSVELEKLLGERKERKSVRVTSRVYPSLRNDSKLLGIDCVALLDAPFIRGVHLLRLQCSVAIILLTKLRDEDLIQFVNKWKEDTNNRLIFLYVTLEDGLRFNRRGIREAVGAERWNPEHRPAVFEKERLNGFRKDFYQDLREDQSKGRDVRGRSGLIGTLSLTRTTFSFVVWH